MPSPLFSIIITTLNGEETVQACLNSIAEQTFLDYELVVVDGGSSDKTVEIINNSSIKNKTVKVVPGIGLYAGLNVGIELAKGQWLYFLGCDDLLYDSQVLQKVSESIEPTNNALKVISGGVQYATQRYIMAPRLGSPYLLKYQLHHQGVFYHKSIFDKHRYNESYSITSDYELNLKLSLEGIPHKKLDLVIALFGEQGISTRKPYIFFEEAKQVHRQLFANSVYVWISTYFWWKKSIWLLRYRLGLLNLTVRFKRYFWDLYN